MISPQYNSRAEFGLEGTEKFQFIYKSLQVKRASIIKREEEKRKRLKLKPSEIFFKFTLEKIHFFIQNTINIDLILNKKHFLLNLLTQQIIKLITKRSFYSKQASIIDQI
jgi:hypothetical protein